MMFNTHFMVNVGQGCSVAVSKILVIWRSDMRAAVRQIKTAKQTNTFIDMTGLHKAKSIIVLDNGMTVATIFTAGALRNRINHQIFKMSSQNIEEAMVIGDEMVDTDMLFDKYDDTLVSENGVG